MGIDGIGGARPPGVPPGAGEAVSGARAATGPERIGGGEISGVAGTAELQGAEAAERTEGTRAAGDMDLARLERGELSVDQYLDLQVERATAHLVDRASPSALEQVRSELREQLATDPVLRTLAEQVTSAER